MAYVFFSPNKQGVISIAANDADKSQIAGHYLMEVLLKKQYQMMILQN